MFCYQTDITFQEVPNEVSLVLSISGCPHQCVGCHSVELWKKSNGVELSRDFLIEHIRKYQGLITCVCFFGGEWEENRLSALLTTVRDFQLKSCLYTGATDVSSELKDKLTYLKTGPWVEELGGLESINTNQRFIELSSGNNMNHYFIKDTHKKHTRRDECLS